MDKKEVVEVLKTISTYYGSKFKMDDPKATVEAWFNILKDYELDEVMVNLTDYVKANQFAPSIADLVKAPERRDRAVLNQEETKAMMQQWEKDRKNAASKEIVDEHLTKMREILGIKRGD